MHHKRNLGRSGPLVSAIGYGAMGLEGYYGPAGEGASLKVIDHAMDTGCTFACTMMTCTRSMRSSMPSMNHDNLEEIMLQQERTNKKHRLLSRCETRQRK